MLAWKAGVVSSSIALLAACGDTAAQSSALDIVDGASERDGAANVDVGSVQPDFESGTGDASTGEASVGDGEAGADVGAASATAIKHVIVIVQENHTFDTYFGRWCTAAPGSNPTCNAGPSCCEAAPAKDPSGASPVTLDDTANAAYDPTHESACEASEMNGGKMDRYVTGASCSNAGNFALATDAVQIYRDWASVYAIADRYFQPLVGQSSANDMYFAQAKWVFDDDSHGPLSSGKGCITIPVWDDVTYSGETTLADVLMKGAPAPKTVFGFYAEGYHAMVASTLCPSPPSDCTMTPIKLPTNPCDYDPSDVPFEYYAQFKDNADYMLDFDDLTSAISSGNLRSVSFVKPVGYHNEHPGYGTTISGGATFVKGLVDQVLGSAYASDTLILVTWDEGGGFFDHVTPPENSAVDGKPYGTRVPLLALGRFAKTGYVSHVTMEHSSVVRFLEWNFLGGVTGQLGARDAVVNGIGDLLDPSEVGVAVP